MATTNDSGYKTFTATAVALAQNVRVLLDSSGTVSVAGATDDWIGTTVEECLASGEVNVRLRNSPGSHFFTASAAVTAGAKLFATAAGKVDDATAGGASIGFEAVDAATADGDIIECVPQGGAAAAGGAPFVVTIPVTMANIADGDLVTTWTPGFNGSITKLDFLVTDAVTTSAKASTLNAEIGTTNLTGGTVALTSANCTPLGAIVAGSAITAANTFVSTDTVSIEASSTTTFVEGAGTLIITGRSL